jgi:hypothetical protein
MTAKPQLVFVIFFIFFCIGWESVFAYYCGYVPCIYRPSNSVFGWWVHSRLHMWEILLQSINQSIKITFIRCNFHFEKQMFKCTLA